VVGVLEEVVLEFVRVGLDVVHVHFQIVAPFELVGDERIRLNESAVHLEEIYEFFELVT